MARVVAVVAVLGFLLPVQPALEAKHPPLTPGLHRQTSLRCQRVLAAGIFHPKSLACYPRLWQEVEKALCSVRVGEAWLPYAAGFGVGANLWDLGLTANRAVQFERHRVDPTAWADWRAEHCGDTEPTTNIEADWGHGYKQPEATYVAQRMYRVLERTQDAFAAARAAAPRSLLGPWEDCTLFYRQLPSDGKAGIACTLIGSYDSGGAEEILYFSVSRIFHPERSDSLLIPLPLPRYFAPKLQRPLQIEGATCSGPKWGKGMRIKGTHTLQCQRLDTSEVKFHLTTSKGDCTKTLPAAEDLPWQTLCGDADLTAIELPFEWPPAR